MVDWDDPALKPTPPRRRDPADSLADELGGHAPERAERRLHAMLRVRRLPPRLQAPLARLALADPAEDVRLFAFSLIERLRAEHEAALRLWTARRAEATTELERGKADLRLAEIQWEMAYHGLCEGAVLEHTLAQALEHTDRALAAAPPSSSATATAAETPIHMLRGRILLRLDRLPAAEAAFRRALGAGHEPTKVLPYLAECAFRLRHFPALRWYLTRLRSVGGSLGPFGPVMEHWL
jgi:tetratricopeptide (TPR) repeat protein